MGSQRNTMRNVPDRVRKEQNAVVTSGAERAMMRKLRVVLFAALTALLAVPAMAQTSGSTWSSGSTGSGSGSGWQFANCSWELAAVATSTPTAQVKMIVQYNHTFTSQDQQQLISLGATAATPMGSFNGAFVSATASSLASMSQIQGITYMSPDREVRSSMSSSTPGS